MNEHSSLVHLSYTILSNNSKSLDNHSKRFQLQLATLYLTSIQLLEKQNF